MFNISKIYQKIVFDHPLILLFVLMLILAFFSYHAPDFRLDASADSLLLEDDKDLIKYNDLVDRYDIKDFLFITFTPQKDLFTRESLDVLKELRDQLPSLPDVDSVISILDIPLFLTSGTSLTSFDNSTVMTLANPNVDLQTAKKEIHENPIYKDLILSEDSQTTAIQILLKSNNQYWELYKQRSRLLNKKMLGTFSPEEQIELNVVQEKYPIQYTLYVKGRQQLIQQIRSIMEPYKQKAGVHLGGVPMIADDMMSFIRKDLVIFGLGVFIFIVATLAFVFRRLRWIILPLLNCFYAVVVMIGILSLLDWEVTVISSNFISLILILTLETNIYLVVRYIQLSRDMSFASQREIVMETVRRMVWPCLYTSLTTILAFGTLVLSGIKPVIDFGWIMTIGLSIAFCTSFVLFPSILVLLKKVNYSQQSIKHSFITSNLAYIVERHGNLVIVVSVIMLIVSVYGISRLQVENSFINYFSKKTEIYKGMKLIDDKLGGTNPMEIIIRFNTPVAVGSETDKNQQTPENDFPVTQQEDDFDWVEEYDSKDYWLTPYKVEQIKAIHDYLDSLPEIGKVLSLASGIRVAEQLNQGKEFDGLELSILSKKIPKEIKTDWIDPYISIDHNEARISVLIRDSLETLRREKLLEKVKQDLKSKFKLSEDDFTIAGLMVLYNNMLQSLFQTQILSMGIEMFGIWVMLLILFRSFSLSVLGIIPELVSVGIVLGLMGLLNIPLDMMTITIASITMGIADDNCIQYIYRFREEFSKTGNYLRTMKICHENVGRAVLNSSATIIFGFSILVLSNFIPTIYFGVFTGLAMLIALLSILILLPKIILLWQPFKKKQ